MKLIIAGSRHFELEVEMINQLIRAHGLQYCITEVVCGECEGVDLAGKAWAEQHGIPIKLFPADFKKLGKKAGPLRNHAMAKYADALLLIWDGQSKGSTWMKEFARREGKWIFEIVATSSL